MKTYTSNLNKREQRMIIPLLPKRGNAHRQKWKVILNALFLRAPSRLPVSKA